MNNFLIGDPKMVKAYSLISAQPGRTGEVAKEVRDMEGVRDVETVAGPYDIVAVIKVGSLEKLTGTIFGKIRGIDGVTNTTTLIAVGAE